MEAVRLLLAELARIQAAPEKDQRTAATDMVVHLGLFVDALESRREGTLKVCSLSGPLRNLATALRALDEGDVHPMLLPDAGKRRLRMDGGEDATQGRRPKLPLYKLLARADGAAAMQIAMDCGAKRTAAAAAAVAKAITGSEVLVGVKRKPAVAVERWRDQILELNEERTFGEIAPGEPAERWAAGAFNEQVSLTRALAATSGVPPKEVADRIIRGLRDRNSPAGQGGNSGLARAKSGRPMS
ncbi:hypothetical protein [Craurococcus roseus]